MQYGCPVLTNLDRHSPADFIHNETVMDIQQLQSWPSRDDWYRVGKAGEALSSRYSWEALMAVLPLER